MKDYKRKNKNSLPVFLIILLVVSVSCQRTEFNVGQTFIHTNSNITLVDTVSAVLSTVFLDSVATSGKGVILAGKYKDNQNPNGFNIGYVKASSYFELGLPPFLSTATPPPSYSVFDSVVLTLYYSNYYYGDTNRPQTISAYQLTEQLTGYTNVDGNFYNTTSFPYNNVPLGTQTFTPHPVAKTSMSIRLSDALGKQLLSYQINGNYNFSSQAIFLDYFNGIYLQYLCN